MTWNPTQVSCFGQLFSTWNPIGTSNGDCIVEVDGDVDDLANMGV
jgi:hypothetical protein